jgi:murein DD-endopeptidase MepM/ murein hydrolase activator NlpD
MFRWLPIAAALVSTPWLSSAAPEAAQKHPSSRVSVHPDKPKHGDAVLVTVLDTTDPPTGHANKGELAFFAVDGGYQAVTAVPLGTPPGRWRIRVRTPDGAAKRADVIVRKHEYPRSTIEIAERFADPPSKLRERVRAEQADIDAAYAQPAAPPRFDEPFQWPLHGTRTSPFGAVYHFENGHRSRHIGVDIDAAEGDPVQAANDGVVVLVQDLALAGKTVILHHGANLYTAYFHLSDALVEKGDEVDRGERIGKVGSTGRATGPHLHWSVRVGDHYVDPTTFMELPLRAPTPPPSEQAPR